MHWGDPTHLSQLANLGEFLSTVEIRQAFTHRIRIVSGSALSFTVYFG